jgi:glucan biosynthesis protein C
MQQEEEQLLDAPGRIMTKPMRCVGRCFRADGSCAARVPRAAAWWLLPLGGLALTALCSYLPGFSDYGGLTVAVSITIYSALALRAGTPDVSASLSAPGEATAMPRPPPAPRLVHIDNLRTAVTAVVVVHHVLGAFAGGGSLGLSLGNFRNPLQPFLVFLQFMDQSWFMCAFFFLAGLVAPPSLRRKGAHGFLIDRLRRLGVPFAIYFWLVSPALTAFVDLAVIGRATAYKLGAGPPWFLAWLLIFSLCLTLVSDGGRREPDFLTCARPGLTAACGVGALLGAAQAAQLVLLPSLFLMPITFGSFPFDCAFFCVGVVACRNGWFAEEAEAQGPAAQPAASARCEALSASSVVVLFAALVAAVLAADWSGLVSGFALSVNACGQPPNRGDAGLASLVALTLVCVAGGAFAVAALVGALALFRARCSTHSRVSALLASHAFAVFLVHPCVVVPLTGAFVALARLRTGDARAFSYSNGVDFSDCVGPGAEGILLAGVLGISALALPLALALAALAKRLPVLRELL